MPKPPYHTVLHYPTPKHVFYPISSSPPPPSVSATLPLPCRSRGLFQRGVVAVRHRGGRRRSVRPAWGGFPPGLRVPLGARGSQGEGPKAVSWSAVVSLVNRSFGVVVSECFVFCHQNYCCMYVVALSGCGWCKIAFVSCAAGSCLICICFI